MLSLTWKSLTMRCAAVALLAAAAVLPLLTAPPRPVAYASVPSAASATCASAPERRTELCFVVLVSRHSIRSPLRYTPPAEFLTRRPAGWPLWAPPANVPGNLTAHGKDVSRALGAFYRAMYAGQALVPPRGRCVPEDEVWVYADTAERTIQTAEGLVQGFFHDDPSGCGAAVHRGAAPTDPVFKPVQSGTARPDLTRARLEIAALAGGPIPSLRYRFRGPFSMMQRVLDCCRPEACVSAGIPAPCGLPDIPTRLVVDEKAGTINLRGGLALAGGFADDFLLQYAEGMPRRDCSSAPGAGCVAWGQITSADLRTMLQLYVLKQTIDNRAPAIARASGSGLMRQILGALRRRAGSAVGAGVFVPPAAKFAAFVGHDTNLSNLGGLLRLSWGTRDYPVNTTPPASALIFELHRNKMTGAYFVRVSFLTMSPDQFRNPAAVSAASPPSRIPLVVGECGIDCPAARFASIVAAAIGGP